jgi:DNA mismatch repair protein MutL
MIHILSKETIDKIAAGEVVERPESVVRELLDNAVDAGADSISVEIRGGGLELIRITDNGSGIDKGDVPVAFIRHATSKLQTAEDIAHVSTMGFRGEALASIAAVSRT